MIGRLLAAGAFVAAAIAVVPYLLEFSAAVRTIAAANSAEKLYSTVMESWRVMLCDGGTGWLNIGLWETPGMTYTAAAEALARRVSAGVPFAPGDVVLDVGCGEGDATVLWASDARAVAAAAGEGAEPAEFVGINVAAPQIAAAEARAAAAGASNVKFVRASALQLPMAAGSVSAVLALESAFHFSPSREAFFAEVARVLKPGGTLRMSDIICSRTARSLRGLWAADWLSAFMNIPPPNQVDAAEYAAHLSAAGFIGVTVESIHGLTYAAFLANYDERVKRAGGFWSLGPKERTFHVLMSVFYRPLMLWTADYVIVQATLPALPVPA